MEIIKKIVEAIRKQHHTGYLMHYKMEDEDVFVISKAELPKLDANEENIIINQQIKKQHLHLSRLENPAYASYYQVHELKKAQYIVDEVAKYGFQLKIIEKIDAIRKIKKIPLKSIVNVTFEYQANKIYLFKIMVEKS